VLSSERDFACLLHSWNDGGPGAASGEFDFFVVILTVTVLFAPARGTELPHRVLAPAHDVAIFIDNAGMFGSNRDIGGRLNRTRRVAAPLDSDRDDGNLDGGRLRSRSATAAAGEDDNERKKDPHLMTPRASGSPMPPVGGLP
jgi:hypothetical protein